MKKSKNRILMLLENSPYSEDLRVKKEANTLTEAGYEVTVVCPADSRKVYYEMVNDVRVYSYPSPPEVDNLLSFIIEYGYAYIVGLFYTFYIAFRHGFDVIHSHNPPEIYVFIAILFKPFGKKFVFDHHDLSPEVYNARSGGEGSRFLYNVLLWMERVTFRFADQVISTNESYKKIAIERGNVSPENVTIVRNGPNLKRFRPIDPEPTIRAKAETIFGYVGDMNIQDGIDYAIRALHILKKDLGRDNFYALFMGDGNELPYLKNLAKELGLEDHVYFTGYMRGETFIEHLASTDICLDPDPYNPFNDKSTMIKMAEYMSMEKPIVAFDLTEHRFTAQDAAIYVPGNNEQLFAEAMVELMDDPERRERMGKYGRQRVLEVLAWKYSANNLVGMYNRLLPLEGKKQEVSYA